VCGSSLLLRSLFAFPHFGHFICMDFLRRWIGTSPRTPRRQNSSSGDNNLRESLPLVSADIRARTLGVPTPLHLASAPHLLIAIPSTPRHPLRFFPSKADFL
jgi:hypothetical protein